MKRALVSLLMAPALSFGAANDLLIDQRNVANTATVTRTIANPGFGVNGLLGYNGTTNLPYIWRLGNSFMLVGGAIESASDWVNVTNKPIFAAVATSGDYNDLINKPSASQINADWSATSGVAEILNKPSLATVATSGDYGDLANTPSIPAAQVNSDWASSSGISQILNKPTTLAGYGITDAYPLTGNPSGFLTSINFSQVTGALGFTPYDASNPSGFVSQSGARSSISLTTTGTSGAATYNPATGSLNIPAYAPPARSFANPARQLNTAFQISSIRDAHVTYTVDISVTSLVVAGQSGRVYLEYADDPGMTTGVVIVNSSPNATGGVLNVTNLGSGNVTGWIPAGKYVRIRTANITGSPAYTFQGSQEVLQ